MKTILFAMLVGLAACGGGGKKTAKPEDKAAPTEKVAAEDKAPAEEKKEEAPPPEEKKPDPEQMKKDAMDAETAAWDKAKPVFEGSCKSCHVKGQKGAKAKNLGMFDCSEYPFKGKKATAADVRRVLGVGDGAKKATMPKNKPGSVKDADLDAIKAWADAFDAAESAGAHAKS